MKAITILYVLFTAISSAFALESPLYPEDGSMPMNYWYYSGGIHPPLFKPGTIDNIEKAFNDEDVRPVILSKYSWIQDLLFFNQNGDFVELPSLGDNENYFPDVTMGVFDSYGWGGGSLTRLSSEEFSLYDKSIDSLDSVFLEGGATITGKFSDGSNYIIMYQARFNAISLAYKELRNPRATDKEIFKAFASDLKVSKKNIILLPLKAGTEHLDLYMKALPGGVLLLDDPTLASKVANKYLKSNNSKKLFSINAYLKKDRYTSKKNHYLKKINIVKSVLEKRFTIEMVAGRFNEYSTNSNNYTGPQELINFFNGVAGINKNGEKFYITNEAEGAVELEQYWSSILQKHGYKAKNTHYPGEYSNGSGLDCMGSPSF